MGGKKAVDREGPDPVDIYVGGRMKEIRLLRRMSQENLARALGVSFQQVQKYERGVNRLSASTLWRAARSLGVPPAQFFMGLEPDTEPGAPDVMSRREAEVVAALRALPAALNEAIHRLVITLAEERITPHSEEEIPADAETE